MNKHITANTTEIGTIAELGGEEVGEVRSRFAVALERGKEACGKVREKFVNSAKATDEAVHTHPYQAIGIALGVGALIGYLVSFRRSRD